MIKIQYMKLLELRGINELEKGQSIFEAVKDSGGNATIQELAETNRLAMMYFLERSQKMELDNLNLKKTNESMQKDVDFMRALEAAGVDNWEGYDIAQDIRDETHD